MNFQTTIDSKIKEARRHNSSYPKGGISCSNDSFVVNQKLGFQIKFCGKSPALRVAAKRYVQQQKMKKTTLLLDFKTEIKTKYLIN